MLFVNRYTLSPINNTNEYLFDACDICSMESMKSVIVGDEFFVAGFLYGGFGKGVVVRDRKDVKGKMDKIIDEGDVGLIVVSKVLVADEMQYINKIKCDASKPLVVEVGALK